MKHLLPRIVKFSNEVFPKHQPLFDELSQGQKPHTLMITCSDSRIDPNLFTQTQPGELFVIRNAGNIVPPFGASRGGEEASIEFAIEGLGVPNIMVCGHSKCGAMSALTHGVDRNIMPCVDNWLSHAHATKRRVQERNISEPIKVVEENVLVQIENLKTHPSVSTALREKRLRIYGCVYQFETGAVLIYDAKLDRFLPSAEFAQQEEVHT